MTFFVDHRPKLLVKRKLYVFPLCIHLPQECCNCPYKYRLLVPIVDEFHLNFATDVALSGLFATS
jgi:hypothetical protein